MKRCSACRERKEEAAFYRNAAQKDGLGNMCKDCAKASVSGYKSRNAEKVKVWRRAYLKRNPDKVKKWREESKRKRSGLFKEQSRSCQLARYYANHENSPCVYFILAKGVELVKIGSTCNLPSRFLSLSCGCPVPLEVLATEKFATRDEATRVERSYQRKFTSLGLRSHGEWYRMADELRSELVRLRE